MSSNAARNPKREAMRFRETPPPPASDLAANVQWLRDREQLKHLYRRYAFGVDSVDMQLVRSVFHPECVVVGTLEEGSLDDYLEGIKHAAWVFHRFGRQ